MVFLVFKIGKKYIILGDYVSTKLDYLLNYFIIKLVWSLYYNNKPEKI